MKSIVRLITLISLLVPCTLWAQKISVTIIDRHTSETNYSYEVPGYSHSSTVGSGGCNTYALGNSANTNCSGSSTTNSTTTAPRSVSFDVMGATYALLLPDQRVVVVNCVSKFEENFAGPAGNHRSCRTPIVDNLDVEFKGKNAKLFWIVSLDGKKVQSETYTILGVLPPQKPQTASAAPTSSN